TASPSGCATRAGCRSTSSRARLPAWRWVPAAAWRNSRRSTEARRPSGGTTTARSGPCSRFAAGFPTLGRLVPRNRDARLAVLGSPVPRSRPAGYSSRSASALRRRIVAGVLVFVSIVLITIYFREPSGGSLHGIQSGGAAVLRPFEVGAERVARPFRDAYGWFAGLFHAKSQNADLRRQVNKLSSQVIRSQNAVQENAELKKLLHYIGARSFPGDYDYVATAIIGRPPTEFQQQVTIDVGRVNGIRQDDPVVNADGLVGVVTKVAHDQSQVT